MGCSKGKLFIQNRGSAGMERQIFKANLLKVMFVENAKKNLPRVMLAWDGYSPSSANPPPTIRSFC
jgi:hypothetical protein